MNCALMFIISNHYGIKCLSNLLQLEPCNVMFKVISDIMAHWNDMLKSNHYGIKCLSYLLLLEACNSMCDF